MISRSFVFGVDYGTDSVRTVLVDAINGEEVISSIYYYPRWKKGLYCDPLQNQYRQHPLDYLEGLEFTVKSCVSHALQIGIDISSIKALSIDTTGSTPIAVDKFGTPLCFRDTFSENPNAMFVLWKDHTSIQEAKEINQHAKNFTNDYLKYVGGIYSSEWFWAKLLHILRTDIQIRENIYTWVEHCDYIPFVLTGGNDANLIKRSVCAAGHKALWNEEFGGLPSEEFFSSLDPLLVGFRDRLFKDTYTSDQIVGNLSEEWANRLGLNTEVKIGVGAFDCHMGAVGGQIEPFYLSKVMGTSTCDMIVADKSEVNGKLIKGICGQVEGSIIPGKIGMEAGQSAFGDAYAWFKNLLLWPMTNDSFEELEISDQDKEKVKEYFANNLLKNLSNAASKTSISIDSELAIDWFNGRRTPDADQSLKAAFQGINLGTDAVNLFQAIVESTCFGAKSIIERFIKEGIQINGLIGLGGVAKKSAYIMQMMADVTNLPIKIHRSEQTCAIGAAMFAATVAGIYPNVEEAMQAMGKGFEKTYFPNEERNKIFEARYLKYKALGVFIEA